MRRESGERGRRSVNINRRRTLQFLIVFVLLNTVFITQKSAAQKISPKINLENLLNHPPESAKPWVFWYWMQAAVSKAGITADLEAMKQNGIGGAYLMTIKGATNPPLLKPAIEQLTPEWWAMVRFAMQEADRLGLKLAMHDSDGFALAGGPWITPELSMQKVVWSKTHLKGNQNFNDTLSKPASYQGYYRDITVFAYPSPKGENISTETVKPQVTTSLPNVDAAFLTDKNNKKNFGSNESCWIQYAFNQPFTCRSITIRTNGNNYQAQRLLLEVSDDGKNFRSLGHLQPPRAGWQDDGFDYTYSILPTTAKYYRFLYDKKGSEPGAEDLDAAKWKPSLKVRGIELSAEAKINQFEGKNGEVWRIGTRTTAQEVPDQLCVPLNQIINLTKNLDADGRLNWKIPAGNWTILRIGHTSTGQTNATGGAGKGLECDKFNPEAVKLQFDKWYGEAIRQAGPELAAKVLKIFHVDSWECGSQNWSLVFAEEFKKRRSYDLLPYLPVMAGIPVQNAAISERFLFDVRQTIAELVSDNFYKTMAGLAHKNGKIFTAESVAPTMVSDGLLHYADVDVPMGEYWLNSPTHDKPNDMLDAVSGAHIYGKLIVQAEAFTTVRMDWSENPSMLKTLQDRNYTLGINRLVYHVFMHNPWTDRKPGMTLDGVGLYFQRDQTWWKPGKAWVDYALRCQTLLQIGKPVTDIAVFTGEETPRRAILPDRLVSALPGIFGKERVENEAKRLSNQGEPLRSKPEGVTHSANMADPENWVNPLNGYAYDSFNKDALLRLAKVENGRVVLPGGASYGLLVLPQASQMSMNNGLMTPEVLSKLNELVKAGATLLVANQPEKSPSLTHFPAADQEVKQLSDVIWNKQNASFTGDFLSLGKGRIICGPYQKASFENLGLKPDFIAKDSTGKTAEDVAFTHRTSPEMDIYFISNQQNIRRKIELSLRINGKLPELYDAVTNKIYPAGNYRFENGRTELPIQLDANASLFVILRKPVGNLSTKNSTNWLKLKSIQTLTGSWKVTFDVKNGGPAKPVIFNALTDWSKNQDSTIRYYSGTASYFKTFSYQFLGGKNSTVWLDLGHIANIAAIKVNGIDCGVAWTAPYRVNITNALKSGVNQLEIEVSNTWHNRLIGDQRLPENKRITWTTAPFRLEGKPLLEAGLFGPVKLLLEE